MLGAARHYSASAADAEDAYQRAVEKLWTKRPADRGDDELLAWLLAVTRNEALMIRRTRSRESSVPFEELAADWPASESPPDDRVIELDFVRRGSEVLARISPDQARCLLLRAEGLSYEEIAAETGFNYAKVHRSLAEGRRRSRGLSDRIETGAECRRLAPQLSMFVDGELKPAERADVDLHLGNCVACQAVLRDYVAAPRKIASFFPVGAAAGVGVFAHISGYWSELVAWVNERLAGHLPSTPAAEIAFGKKVALATAMAGTIVAGGAGAERFATHDTVGDSVRGAATVRRAVDAVPTPRPRDGGSKGRPESPNPKPDDDARIASRPDTTIEADPITARPTDEPDEGQPRRYPREVTTAPEAAEPDAPAEAPPTEVGDSPPEDDPEWP